MRRAASPPQGEARPQKHICPPQTCSPHSDLSQPPLKVWCAERDHPHFSSVLQLGDAFVFPPLQSVIFPPAGHVLGDTAGSLLQRADPVPATFQSSTSLSINPNKDAEGFPSWWRASLLPGLLDTPTQVCLPVHDTLLPLSHLIHEWERLPGVSLWALMNNLPVEVQETIASARAPATRKLYSSKWGIFESWCLARAIDPVNYPVGPVLEFLQERLTAGAAATTLRVYVAAIAARRELDEIPLGRHRMVSAFMRGVRRLRPTRPTAVPSWDLSVVLEGLVTAPFEPLESAPERILTLKVTLLLALTSLKRVGDLQALSVSEMCMDFAPGLVKLILRPRPGYIPKVLSTSFRSQVVTLHSFHPPPFASSEDEKLHMLCPVRALKLYVDHSKVWRKSSQLLVCFRCWPPRACHIKTEDFFTG